MATIIREIHNNSSCQNIHKITFIKNNIKIKGRWIWMLLIVWYIMRINSSHKLIISLVLRRLVVIRQRMMDLINKDMKKNIGHQ